MAGDRAVARLKPREVLSGEIVLSQEQKEVMTASAQLLFGSAREQYAVQYRGWQDELWTYTKAIGEYGSVMDWFAAGISRMHLRAAVLKPGQREPEFIDEDDNDPAVMLTHRLVKGAKNGETQFLYKWGRQLGVPGVGFFVGREEDNGLESFDVKSAKQIRRSNWPFKGPDGRQIKRADGTVLTGYDVRTGPDMWEKLPINQIVGRIYRPDDELDYEPTSWSRGALSTLREIDLYNRHIVATLLSRLVFNGILFIPEEVTFPVNPQFKDAPDPFIAELIAIASRGIKDPGSPASAMPIPIRVPAAFVDKFQHLIIANGIDPGLIDARRAAVENLAKMLPSPPEAMNGKSDMNHWSAWKDSEDNVKMYFGPTMEILVGGLCDVYLWPMLQAAGQPLEVNGARRVIWYDPSDLIVQPDNSQNAELAYEKGAITAETYRKAMGFDEDDKPTDDERREQILITLATAGMPIPDSFYLLYPEDKPDPQEQAIEGAEAQAAANEILADSPGVVPAAGPSGAAPGGKTTTKTAPNQQKSKQAATGRIKPSGGV